MLVVGQVGGLISLYALQFKVSYNYICLMMLYSFDKVLLLLMQLMTYCPRISRQFSLNVLLLRFLEKSALHINRA